MTPRKNSHLFADIDGLVHDEKTGLQWQAGPIYVTSWYEDIRFNKWLKGRTDAPSDWRLPTILELMSLFELDVPLSKATISWGRYGGISGWAKGTEQQRHITPLLEVPDSLASYLAYVKEDVRTSFSLINTFHCGASQWEANVLAVRDFTNPNLACYTPEELIEQLGYIWVVDFPGEVNAWGGLRVVTKLLGEAKKAEDLLITMGASAVPVLVSALKLSDPYPETLSMREKEHDHYDHFLFTVESWRHDEKRGGYESIANRGTLRYRPCLARQGAIRVLKQMRENPEIASEVINRINLETIDRTEQQEVKKNLETIDRPAQQKVKKKWWQLWH